MNEERYKMLKSGKFFISLVVVVLLTGCGRESVPARIMLYDKPAAYFEEALPLSCIRLV